MFFRCVLFKREKNVSPDTVAVGLANQRTDSQAPVELQLLRHHHAIVSKHNTNKKQRGIAQEELRRYE